MPGFVIQPNMGISRVADACTLPKNMESIMKNMIKAITLTAVLTVCAANANAFGLGDVAGGAAGGGASSGSLKTDAPAFIKYVGIGSYQLALAAAKMEEAAGHADIAENLRLLADNYNKDPSSDNFTKLSDALNKVNISSAEVGKIDAAKGREALGYSAVHMGLGVLADKKAADLAQKLVSAKPSPSDLMDGQISSAINVATTAVNALPDHLQKAGTWTSYLTEYFTSHKITPPSDDEKKKVAADAGASELF